MVIIDEVLGSLGIVIFEEKSLLAFSVSSLSQVFSRYGVEYMALASFKCFVI